MLSIDEYAYTNKLRQQHPLEKFSLAMGTLLVSLITSSWKVHILIAVFMTILIIYVAGIPLKAYKGIGLLPLFFLCTGALGVALVINKDLSLLKYGFNVGEWAVGVSQQSLIQGKKLFFRAFSAILCIYFLAFTTPMVDIIRILKSFKVPSIITELMMIIYRFIFVLTDTAVAIYIAQECRLGYTSLRKGYGSFGELVANLFVKAFYSSKELFIGLSARGYSGNLDVLEEEYILSKKNLVRIAIIEITFFVLGFVL